MNIISKKNLTELLNIHGNSLYGIAFQRTQSETLAAEILKQTFAVACQKIATYDATKESSFRWILNIMHQVIKDNYSYQIAA
ncbi:MAG: sigma factor [Bacteroidota bacterium]